jgi:uncharacterized membrane protein
MEKVRLIVLLVIAFFVFTCSLLIFDLIHTLIYGCSFFGNLAGPYCGALGYMSIAIDVIILVLIIPFLYAFLKPFLNRSRSKPVQ